jgi:hypothetical protein
LAIDESSACLGSADTGRMVDKRQTESHRVLQKAGEHDFVFAFMIAMKWAPG